MLSLVRLAVNCRDLDYLAVTWEVAPTAEDLLSYSFRVLRSEATEGPYEPITEPFSDRYEFRDYIAPRRHEWRLFHYKIAVTHVESGESAEFGPVTAHARPPLDALEIVRLETVLFREFVGRPCLLVPIRTFGQTCPQCYDTITGRVTLSNCPMCYTTGYTGGYLNPTVIYIQIDPSARMQQSNPPLTQQHVMSTGRCSADIYVKPKDILVEENGKRWRVTAVSTTERLRFPVRQELQLTAIPIGDIEYGLSLEWPTVATSPRSYEYSGRV
jgi:hypothetical protein